MSQNFSDLGFYYGINSGSLTASVTSQTLIPANPDRKTFTIFNDSTSICFVRFGDGVNSANFMFKLAASDYYESIKPPFPGNVSIVWVSATGSAKWTEIL